MDLETRRDSLSRGLRRTSKEQSAVDGTPAVTVLMSVHNGGRYLCESVESVLEQTHPDFEFVIIDDGSTDGTPALLDGYADRDSRVVVVHNKEKIGLTKSLNLGLKEARGEYVARIDADDICAPNRLERQCGYLDEHPDVAVVGSWATIIDAEGKGIGLRQPRLRGKGDGAYALLRGSHRLLHPSITIRRTVMTSLEGYDESVRTAQDYDLWVRLAVAGHEGAIIEEALISYRDHTEQITTGQRDEQEMSKGRTYEQLLRRFWDRDLDLVKRFLEKDAGIWGAMTEEDVQGLVDLLEGAMPRIRSGLHLGDREYAEFRKLWGRFMMQSACVARRMGGRSKGSALVRCVRAEYSGSLFSLAGLSYCLSCVLGCSRGRDTRGGPS